MSDHRDHRNWSSERRTEYRAPQEEDSSRRYTKSDGRWHRAGREQAGSGYAGDGLGARGPSNTRASAPSSHNPTSFSPTAPPPIAASSNTLVSAMDDVHVPQPDTVSNTAVSATVDRKIAASLSRQVSASDNPLHSAQESVCTSNAVRLAGDVW